MFKKGLLSIMACSVLFILLESRIHADENEVVDYTDYGLSLVEAVAIQMNHGAATTSDYSASPAYIPLENVGFVEPIIALKARLEFRREPNLTSELAYTMGRNVPLEIVGVVAGELLEDSELWYEVMYEGELYYVHSAGVLTLRLEVLEDTEVRAGRADNQHVYGKVSAGSFVGIEQLHEDWVAIQFDHWRTPKEGLVEKYLNPSENDAFQHLRLDSSIDVPAEELDVVLAGKGVLDGQGAAFIEAAQSHGVNEAYLIAHAILETGIGTSDLARGIEVGLDIDENPVVVTEKNRSELAEVKVTYNMFGIGAADSCPVECGAITAYEQAWFTPEEAIIGGAEWIRSGYIYNEFSQNTLYKMRWNPQMVNGQAWKQYATDIGWAEKQTERIRDIYEQLADPVYHYDYPVYLDK